MLKHEIKGISNDLKNVEESVEIEVNSLKEEMTSLEVQQQNISHAISSQLANFDEKQSGSKEKIEKEVSNINTTIDIKLAKQEATINQEMRAILKIVENTKISVNSLDDKVKNNIINISEKLNSLEKMNDGNSTGLIKFDTKQLREQIQNKFDQQSKTNKLIFDSIQLVACKIKEITEEKYE